MRLDDASCLERLLPSDHGVLATVDEQAAPHAVPVCFAVHVDSGRLAVPVDEVKPKSTTDLRRVRNLEERPSATLLVEHWDPVDWSALWWVRADLTHLPAPSAAELDHFAAALADRYPQYRGEGAIASISVFTVDRLSGWSAT